MWEKEKMLVSKVASSISRVRIQQPFPSIVFFFKVCRFECSTTSDWLNRMMYFDISTVEYFNVHRAEIFQIATIDPAELSW